MRWRSWWPASSMKTDKKSKKSGEEVVLEGLGVAPGVAIGPAHVRETGELQVIDYPIPAGKVKAESKRLVEAVGKPVRTAGQLTAKVIGRAWRREIQC